MISREWMSRRRTSRGGRGKDEGRMVPALEEYLSHQKDDEKLERELDKGGRHIVGARRGGSMDVKKLAADILGTRRVRTSEQGQSGMTRESDEGGEEGSEARKQLGDRDVMQVSLGFRVSGLRGGVGEARKQQGDRDVMQVSLWFLQEILCPKPKTS
jgi:hypothetical protein